jgi:hypothetical protein
MGYDLLDAVRVIRDCEVEAPVFIHTSLPDVSAFIVLFRVQRWIGEILHEKGNLLEKCLANPGDASSIASSARRSLSAALNEGRL